MKMNKTLVALSLVFAISACSESQNAQSHLTKAKEYISANQINESIIELKNTLRIDNKNSEARFLLGKQYLFQGKGNLATKELEHALANQYSKTKVVPLLAQAYMLIDSANEVYLLDKYSESLPNEAKSHYLAYKTKAALFDNKIADAENFVKQTQSLSPGNLYSLLAESYLALAQKNLLKAETLTGQILAINAKHSDTLMLQGQVALAANNFKQAVSSFEQHLQLQPYSGITQLLLAEAYLLSGNNVKAELLADEVLAKVNRQPFATYIKAMVRFAEQDYQQSSELAEVALQSKVNKPSLKLVAGASAFQLKKYELSYQHLNEITPYLPKNHVARRMLVICQLKLGMIDDISKTLSD
jgi:putative PEP-CTERM system TPR-repeat lipoprotein